VACNNNNREIMAKIMARNDNKYVIMKIMIMKSRNDNNEIIMHQFKWNENDRKMKIINDNIVMKCEIMSS